MRVLQGICIKYYLLCIHQIKKNPLIANGKNKIGSTLEKHSDTFVLELSNFLYIMRHFIELVTNDSRGIKTFLEICLLFKQYQKKSNLFRPFLLSISAITARTAFLLLMLSMVLIYQQMYCKYFFKNSYWSMYFQVQVIDTLLVY